jgi:hypothetical protein
MAYTGSAAKARALAKVGKSAQANHCLQEVRGVFGIGAKYPSAVSAWNHAAHRHVGARPPAGAVVPVFFNTSNPYEHVAIAIGDGRVVTINGSRWSIYSSIEAMASAWRVSYLGYSEDLNGVRLYTPPKVIIHSSCTALQGAVRASKDNVWGPDSAKRLNAVRAASAWKGGKFPYGKAYTQGVVGVKKDGIWGSASAAGHDKTVRAIQKAVGAKVDGIYGPATDAAVSKYLAKAKKS